jgi:amino-acid N-acetyltransferase
MAWNITPAREQDAPGVFDLLQRSGLPIDGLAQHLGTMLVARDADAVVGSAALEVYPDGVLLRSVAVAPPVQRGGLGRQLTDAAIRLAQDLHAPAIYLLTTTAEEYFPKFGFQRISRADVPPAVQTSIEFTSVCPSSAIVMRKPL